MVTETDESGERATVDYEFSVEIEAAPDEVWRVMTDVERWPEWTPTMQRVERLDEGPFQVGSRARIKQPKFPPLVWRVTELEPERWFSWTTHGAGVKTLGGHRITPRGDGVEVSLSIRQTGPLGWLVARLASGLTQRYIQTEANGLKRRCEA